MICLANRMFFVCIVDKFDSLSSYFYDRHV
jgi:hypothetical protein